MVSRPRRVYSGMLGSSLYSYRVGSMAERRRASNAKQHFSEGKGFQKSQPRSVYSWFLSLEAVFVEGGMEDTRHSFGFIGCSCHCPWGPQPPKANALGGSLAGGGQVSRLHYGRFMSFSSCEVPSPEQGARCGSSTLGRLRSFQDKLHSPPGSGILFWGIKHLPLNTSGFWFKHS